MRKNALTSSALDEWNAKQYKHRHYHKRREGIRTKPSRASRNTATKTKHDSNRQITNEIEQLKGKIKLSKMHTNFHNEDTMRCSNMVGRSMLACQLQYRKSQAYFLHGSASASRACTIYILTVYSTQWTYCLWRQWLGLNLVNSFKDHVRAKVRLRGKYFPSAQETLDLIPSSTTNKRWISPNS